jgi:hypothetical protein
MNEHQSISRPAADDPVQRSSDGTITEASSEEGAVLAPRVRRIYRTCIWLPIVVPVMLIVVVNAVGARLASAVGVVGEMIAYSLIWGGLPYTVLAIWATRWIGDRAEPEIRRLMFRAPLLMVAVFVPLALVIGLVVGAPGPFAAVAAVGTVVIIVLGYVYVGVTVLVRLGLGARD